MSASAVIHPTAIVADGAEIGDGVEIGPFCVISAATRIGDGVSFMNSVTTIGRVTIGARTKVAPYAVLGGAPQITRYEDGDTSLEIGEGCDIREHVTMHRGSTRDKGVTRVGARCYMMDSAHVGHDAIVGDDCILARGATLGGHSVLGDDVYIGGLSAIHQFTRVGRRAFIGGVVPVTRDVIPFAIVNGNPARLEGLNITGLKRRRYTTEQIRDMLTAFDLMFRGEDATFKERVIEVTRLFADRAEVQEIVAFVQAPTKRGLCTLV